MTTNLRNRAAKAQAEADAANQRANAINERFEFGQPIIQNHHSTKSALRDRDASDAAMRRAISAQERADALNRLAGREERKAVTRAHLESANITQVDVSPGDIVQVADLNTGHTEPYIVKRANAKSVSVQGPWGTDRIPYDRIVKVVER